MTKRIIYLMHVDWDWIKQRPHFIAQHLASKHDLLIFYPFSRIRSVLSKNSRQGLKICPMILIRRRPALLHAFYRFFMRLFFRLTITIFRPDYIWLTYPELFDYLPTKNKVPVIYDCMDDVQGFDAPEYKKKALLELENQLLSHAAHIFCSSEHLKQKITSRTDSKISKITLVRNAFEPNFSESTKTSPPIPAQKGKFTMGYLGTVSPWIDLDALKVCVDHFADLDIHMVGPVDQLDVSAWQNSNIYFHGPVEHKALSTWAACFDLLIVPFRINNLTLSVDPVKLYEYIFFNKPIICAYYPEIERFSAFVSYYSNQKDLINAINRFTQNGFKPEYSQDQKERFLKANTWQVRMKTINKVLCN